MISERRKAANQANARLSTGPKSEDGKRIVRLNGLQHGLLARDIVLPGEDTDAFEKLRFAALAEFAPVGPVEEFLVERVVHAMWRLRRLERVEAAIFDWRMSALKADALFGKLTSYENDAFSGVAGGVFDVVITDHALHAEAKEEFRQAKQERDRNELLVGRAFYADAKDGDAFGKLARYETRLERSLDRAIRELHRFQEERRSRPKQQRSRQNDQQNVNPG